MKSTMTALANKPLVLEINPSWQQQRLKEAARNHSSEFGRRNALINSIMKDAILEYFKTEAELEDESILVSPERKKLPSIWEFVPGFRIELGNTGMVFVPWESEEIDSLDVPGEWVDIPDWAAEYYLGVRVNLEDGWVKILGGTTYQKLTREEGQYDEVRRCYSLKKLFSFNVILVSSKYCRKPKPAVANLTALSSLEAENLLARYGKSTAHSPRKLAPLGQWLALVEDDKLRAGIVSQQGRVYLG